MQYQMYDPPSFDLRSMPGVCAPLGFWDPMGFTIGASEGRIKFLRECEIKHSRLAMLAAVGWVAGEQVPKSVPAYIAWEKAHISGGLVFFFVFFTEVFSIFTFNSPFGGELFSIRSDYANGDMDWDPLGLKPRDPIALKDMQTKELNNGRLAMIAWAGMAAEELHTHHKLFH